MRRIIHLRLSPAPIVASVVAVLIVGGVAAASVPTSSGLISACYRTHGGALRIIHTAKHGSAGKCHKSEKRLAWSQQGPRGSQGAQGTRGVQGIQGAQGIQGKQGIRGTPGPVTSIAPSGLTQRGLFDVEGYDNPPNLTGGGISFPFELTSAPKVVEVPSGATNPDPTHCSGTPDQPTAAPGFLCLYDRTYHNVVAPPAPLVAENVDGSFGASPFGVWLNVEAATTGVVFVEGSWAVTAP
jgi:hypothetical protein